VINGGISMQNLINQLLQPALGESKPSTLKRRAGEALALALNMQQQDLQGRQRAEAEAQQNLGMLESLRASIDMEEYMKIYKETLNKEYYENCA
jgi:hypothetical protein